MDRLIQSTALLFCRLSSPLMRYCQTRRRTISHTQFQVSNAVFASFWGSARGKSYTESAAAFDGRRGQLCDPEPCDPNLGREPSIGTG